jgi:hypothetical protein
MEVNAKKVAVSLALGFHFIVDCEFKIDVELDFGNLDGWDDWSKIPRKIMVISLSFFFEHILNFSFL